MEWFSSIKTKISYCHHLAFIFVHKHLKLCLPTTGPIRTKHGRYITWVILNITCFSFDSEIQHVFYDQFFLMLKFQNLI